MEERHDNLRGRESGKTTFAVVFDVSLSWSTASGWTESPRLPVDDGSPDSNVTSWLMTPGMFCKVDDKELEDKKKTPTKQEPVRAPGEFLKGTVARKAAGES